MAHPQQLPNPFLLAVDDPTALLSLLASDPSIAPVQDFSGYSLVHAAASYNQRDLLRILIKDYHVPVDIKDEDGETALFVVENVEMAQILVEELGASLDVRNDEDKTAEEKIREEGDFTIVADYLTEARRQRSGGSTSNGDASVAPQTNGANGVRHPPPLPEGLTINMGTMAEEDAGSQEEVDQEFKRRIEELASREDFGGEESQRELRELVAEAVRGAGTSQERDVRRRID